MPNYFALLADDDEGGNVPAVTPATKGAPSAASASKSGPQQQKSSSNNNSSNNTASNTEDRKASRQPRNEYPRRGGARSAAPAVSHDESGAVKERNGDYDAKRGDGAPRRDRGEREGRGSGGGRGGRGGGGHFRGREFDRHSGNPRHDGEKKDVAGKGTWGDAVKSEEQATDDVNDATVEKVGEATEDKAVQAADQTVPEPEEKVKTLTEYLAEREATKPAPAVIARKANEGTDDSKWKDAVVFQKAEEEEFFSMKAAQKTKKVKEVKTKVALDIEQRFADEQPSRPQTGDRGGRGERGGNRGGNRGGYDSRPQGRGRGGFGRGGSANVVNVEDTSAFPSLGR